MSAAFAKTLASLPVHNALPEGFDKAVDGFEAWVERLLLDAVQRLGFFTQPGQVRRAKEACHTLILQMLHGPVSFPEPLWTN